MDDLLMSFGFENFPPKDHPHLPIYIPCENRRCCHSVGIHNPAQHVHGQRWTFSLKALLLQPKFLETLNELSFNELSWRNLGRLEKWWKGDMPCSKYVMEWLLGVLCDGGESW